MAYAKKAITKSALSTKMAGVEGLKEHKAGTKCTYQRHGTEPGRYVIWIGKRFAVIEAVRLHEVLFIADGIA